jgi:hypothetical protein
MADLDQCIDSLINRRMSIEQQTPELCIKIVKKCGVYLQFIDNQTHEMCSEAINQHPVYLYFASN